MNKETRTLGRFRIEGEFRNDGPGRLYHGLSEGGQPVLVSVIPAALARHAVQVADRGLRPVDLGSLENGDIFLVYDIPSGETVARSFERGPMPWIDAVTAFAPTLDSLAALHAEGRAYGEIAPTRMVLRPNMGVTLIGRELKQLAQAFNRRNDNAWPSTDVVPYLSPERARGGPPMPASDIFAMAAVIYEAITGFRPFEAKGLLELLFQIQTVDVCALRDYDPTIPLALSELIARALEKDPTRRPTASGMAEALRLIGAIARQPVAPRRDDIVLPNPSKWSPSPPPPPVAVVEDYTARPEASIEIATGPVDVDEPPLTSVVEPAPVETPAVDPVQLTSLDATAVEAPAPIEAPPSPEPEVAAAEPAEAHLAHAEPVPESEVSPALETVYDADPPTATPETELAPSPETSQPEVEAEPVVAAAVTEAPAPAPVEVAAVEEVEPLPMGPLFSASKESSGTPMVLVPIVILVAAVIFVIVALTVGRNPSTEQAADEAKTVAPVAPSPSEVPSPAADPAHASQPASPSAEPGAAKPPAATGSVDTQKSGTPAASASPEPSKKVHVAKRDHRSGRRKAEAKSGHSAADSSSSTTDSADDDN
jgi:serine/threonine protein kinase